MRSKLRSLGIVTVNYLDDLLLLGDSFDNSKRKVEVAISLIRVRSLGFIINIKNSTLVSTRRCKFLGFVFDSVAMAIELTQSR
nr:unnamed protein product [Callosobruchus analis]